MIASCPQQFFGENFEKKKGLWLIGPGKHKTHLGPCNVVAEMGQECGLGIMLLLGLNLDA